LRAFLKSLKSKFGVTAPKVAVYAHMPWYMRWAGLLAGIAVLAGAGWVVWQYGSEFAGFRKSEIDREMKQLHETVSKQQAELAELRTRLAAAERQAQIEIASQGEVAKQVKTLSGENAKLKEDLAFFQSVLPVSGRDEAVSIGRFKLEPEAVPGEFRFRVLVVQGGQQPREFQGHLQLVVGMQEGVEKRVLTLPSEKEPGNKEFLLNFKSFQRLEGVFKVAPGAVIKTVQVRVYENGARTPKLTQSVNI
jgi:hypothetical protein